MIARSNYLFVQEHLKYLGEVMQTAPASVDRYRFHLRHLLIWADKKPWLAAPEIRPTFPVYLKSLSGENGQRPLAAVTQEKVLKVSRRFFRWLRDIHCTSSVNGAINSACFSPRRPYFWMDKGTKFNRILLMG